MNRIYNSIWNSSLCSWVAVPETARKSGKASLKGSVNNNYELIRAMNGGMEGGHLKAVSTAVLACIMLLAMPNTWAAPSIKVVGNVNIDNINNETDLNIPYYFVVGNYDLGSVEIFGGATITNNGAHIGSVESGIGVVTVTGEGSSWRNGLELYMGFFGTGTLNVNDGGYVSSITGTLGNAAGSSGRVVVDGAGSIFESTQRLYVGVDGSGRMEVKNGGEAISREAFIGTFAGSDGSVLVSGKGSHWEVDEFVNVGGWGRWYGRIYRRWRWPSGDNGWRNC